MFSAPCRLGFLRTRASMTARKYGDVDAKTVIDRLVQLHNGLQEDGSATQRENPDWNAGDARITIFWTLRSVVGVALLGCKITMREPAQLTKLAGLRLQGEEDSPRRLGEFLEEQLHIFLRAGVIQTCFGIVDANFRAFLRAIDAKACDGATLGFHKIARSLLQKLKIHDREGRKLLDLWAEIRNSTHNHGYYVPMPRKRGGVRKSRDKRITYKGTTYPFRIGKQVNFLDWYFILEIVEDIRPLLKRVVNAPRLRKRERVIAPLPPK